MADLLPGDIGLTRSAGTVGALIRFGERVRADGWVQALVWLAKKIVGVGRPDDPADLCWVNHAFVGIGDGWIVEALADGLTLSRLSKYDPARLVIVRLADLVPDVTDVTRARVVAFAESQLARHDRYGWASIASIVLQLLTPLRLDISWDGALICSAFAAMCAEHAGYTLPTRSALTTMPSEIRSFRPQPTPPGSGSVPDVALLGPVLHDPQTERLQVPSDQPAA